MRTVAEIRELLNLLEKHTADDLEGQDLDFKEWDDRSRNDAIGQMIEMAVCMANGGGGTVVFGVRDKMSGRALALVGVPLDLDANRLKRSIYDETDPKLTPEFQELQVPEGTGRLLIMQIHGGLAPYTDTAGRGKVRIGKDCMPLTGSERVRMLQESGEADYSSVTIDARPEQVVSPAAMEMLRDIARREGAPDDLLRQTDIDLLGALHVLVDGRLTRAGVLLAGREEFIRAHVPNFAWTHLRMKSDTDYTDRADGTQALPVSLTRLEERIMANNPITTVEMGMFHFEYRAYPQIALREALMNALCHADWRVASPVMVKQYADRLEIANPGGFIGGITPENILHHTPMARNRLLVEALTRLRLVNRSNLGVSRMFSAMLVEGKEPPRIEANHDFVRVTFKRQEISAPFRMFIAEEDKRGRALDVDRLIVLRHLLSHREVDTATAARLCQRSEADMLDILDRMARIDGYLERGGAGRGTYWEMRPELHKQLAGPGHAERDRRIEWEAAKTRVVSVLMQRARKGESGLTNAEVRQIAHLDRSQVKRLMAELRGQHPELGTPGRGRGARYEWEIKKES